MTFLQLIPISIFLKISTSSQHLVMAGILQESFVLKTGHLPLVNHFIYDANTWISEDEHLLESFKAGFFSHRKNIFKQWSGSSSFSSSAMVGGYFIPRSFLSPWFRHLATVFNSCSPLTFRRRLQPLYNYLLPCCHKQEHFGFKDTTNRIQYHPQTPFVWESWFLQS